MTAISNCVFLLLCLLFTAVSSTSSHSPLVCTCTEELKGKYENLTEKYNSLRGSVVKDMKKFVGGDQSSSKSMESLEHLISQANKDNVILKKRSDSFAALMLAVLNDQKHHALVSYPQRPDKCSNGTTFSCSTRRQSLISSNEVPISLCLWERTRQDNKRAELIIVDEQGAESADGTALDGVIHASEKGFRDGACELTVLTTTGQVSHWSCTLVTVDRDVYYATVKVKEPDARTCKASSISLPTSYVLFQLSLLWTLFLAKK